MNVVSFYRFVDIENAEQLRDDLQVLCEQEQLLGTILVAGEGINGSLAGEADAIRRVFRWLEQRLSLELPLEGRWTAADTAPFRRMRVRVKPEIVTLGRPDILPQRGTGRHVPPDEWNRLIDDPRTLLIDTRNHYEIEVGSFPGALDPGTDSFRQFPAFARALAEQDMDRPVAMYCTGGIRCEKYSSYLLERGFTHVYHLSGGILNYLALVPEAESLWDGACYVFDERVAVNHDLTPASHITMCGPCGQPLAPDDRASMNGEHCPYCITAKAA